MVGIISPWNYPFSIPATGVLAALVAGNAVVLKPSELTPLIALELEAILGEAGVPEDIFQVLPGEGETGAALVASAIDKLVFTGSVATGRRIAQIAAERLLPVVLELGGKDAMLVLDDADIDVASSGAVWGAFMNAGQTCLSVERCYVHRSLYADFLDACCEKARKLRVGNGMNEAAAADIGPMIHERQVRVVEAHIEDARQRGARVLTGGARLMCEDSPQHFLRPPCSLASTTRCASCGKRLSARCCRLRPSPTMGKPYAWPTIPSMDWLPAFGLAIAAGASAWPARSMPAPSW